jgi:hypothetical protein
MYLMLLLKTDVLCVPVLNVPTQTGVSPYKVTQTTHLSHSGHYCQINRNTNHEITKKTSEKKANCKGGNKVLITAHMSHEEFSLKKLI